jgi:hypothetical protein
MLDDYAKAKSKLDKSGVLASLVDQIRAASPNGGFVKQDESGRWFEVGDFLAREKTSQAFRDALHERYKSSNVAKKKRRQEEQARAHDKFRRMARTYSDDSATAARLEWLSLGDSRMTGLRKFARNTCESAIHGRCSHGRSDLGRRYLGSNPFLPLFSPSSHLSLPTAPLAASDPRFQMYAQRQGMDAAARLSRLADMRQRLNSRYGASGNVGSTASSSRPSSAMSQLIHRYPDPLLGPTSSTSVGLGAPGSASLNAFPARVSSSFDNADAYGGEIDLNDLMAARRLEETDDEYSVRTEVSMMHHSMPNIHMGVAGSGSTSGGGRDTWNPYNVEVEPSLHYSAPDLMCSEAFHRSAPNLKYGGGTEEGDEGEESMSNDMDPIPLDQYTPKPFPKRRLGADDFKKPISMALSPTSPSTEAVSRDLLACLEKLTGSSIKDENPFEPLPLDPGTSSARAASAPSSSSAAQVRHEPMDAQRVTRDKKPSPFESHGKLTPPPPFS